MGALCTRLQPGRKKAIRSFSFLKPPRSLFCSQCNSLCLPFPETVHFYMILFTLINIQMPLLSIFIFASDLLLCWITFRPFISSVWNVHLYCQHYASWKVTARSSLKNIDVCISPHLRKQKWNFKAFCQSPTVKGLQENAFWYRNGRFVLSGKG